MIFVDTKNIFLIGGAAVAVLAGAYVIWGPSERKRNKGNRRGNAVLGGVFVNHAPAALASIRTTHRPYWPHHITSHGEYRSRPPKASVSEK